MSENEKPKTSRTKLPWVDKYHRIGLYIHGNSTREAMAKLAKGKQPEKSAKENL